MPNLPVSIIEASNVQPVVPLTLESCYKLAFSLKTDALRVAIDCPTNELFVNVESKHKGFFPILKNLQVFISIDELTGYFL